MCCTGQKSRSVIEPLVPSLRFVLIIQSDSSAAETVEVKGVVSQKAIGFAFKWKPTFFFFFFLLHQNRIQRPLSSRIAVVFFPPLLSQSFSQSFRSFLPTSLTNFEFHWPEISRPGYLMRFEVRLSLSRLVEFLLSLSSPPSFQGTQKLNHFPSNLLQRLFRVVGQSNSQTQFFPRLPRTVKFERAFGNISQHYHKPPPFSWFFQFLLLFHLSVTRYQRKENSFWSFSSGSMGFLFSSPIPPVALSFYSKGILTFFSFRGFSHKHAILFRRSNRGISQIKFKPPEIPFFSQAVHFSFPSTHPPRPRFSVFSFSRFCAHVYNPFGPPL